ncbi:MAG: M48 family metalloprotease, partial [Halococcoides sp.]
MDHPGLKARMAVMGTILFGFYAVLVAFFQQVLSLPIVIAGTVVFVAIQYKLGKYLAIRSVNGRDLDETEYEWVHDRLDRLADEMDIPRPRLMVGDMGVPNAFAVGRQGASVIVVSETLIELLDRDELEGVLAHECAHITNRDVIMMLIGQSIASMLGITVF